MGVATVKAILLGSLNEPSVTTLPASPALPCGLIHPPSYNMPSCEAPMPFTLRLYQRFPVQRQGTIWNILCAG